MINLCEHPLIPILKKMSSDSSLLSSDLMTAFVISLVKIIGLLYGLLTDYTIYYIDLLMIT